MQVKYPTAHSDLQAIILQIILSTPQQGMIRRNQKLSEKKWDMFPDALLLPPRLQLLKFYSDLEWPGCEDLVV